MQYAIRSLQVLFHSFSSINVFLKFRQANCILYKSRTMIYISLPNSKYHIMHSDKVSRTSYTEANDRTTFMTDLERCVKKLAENGYTDQFRVENGKLQSLIDSKKKY